MRVAITGEKGFLGIHLVHYLRNILKCEVVELGRDYLDSLSRAEDIDWLIHGACVHRHSDPVMVLKLNNEITGKTIECLNNNNIRCNVILLSSIHENKDTFYGRSKIEAKTQFEKYCFDNNTDFVSYQLPNIFGQYAKPNNTSFIATFCFNLFNNIPIQYNSDLVNLAYIDDVVQIICSFKEREISSTRTTVEEVYLLLIKFFDDTNFPTFKNKLEFDLYQTFLTYKDYKI